MDDQMTEDAVRFYAASHLLRLKTSEAEDAAELLARNPDMTTYHALHDVWFRSQIEKRRNESPPPVTQEIEEDFSSYWQLMILSLVDNQPRHAVPFDPDDYREVFYEIKAYAIINGYIGRDPGTLNYVIDHYHTGYPEEHWSRILWTILKPLHRWQIFWDTFLYGGITFGDDESATTKGQGAG